MTTQPSATPRTTALAQAHNASEQGSYRDRYEEMSDHAYVLETELAAAKELLREIRDNEVNASDEADKFLRDHQPSELERLRAEVERLTRELGKALASHEQAIARAERAEAQLAAIQSL